MLLTRQWIGALVVFAFVLLACPTGNSTNAQTESVRMVGVDSIIQQAISDNNIPGAVLVVGHNGSVVYRKAYGSRALEPRREVMSAETIFDLASLTKVIATHDCGHAIDGAWQDSHERSGGEIFAGVCAKRQG